MNAKRKEDMIGVISKRRIPMQHGELSQGNRDTMMYTTTPDHNIQSTAQGKAQALCAGKHFRCVIGNDDCSPD